MATNWIYTGTSVQFADKVRGRKIERSTKHRYVFFLNAADRASLQWEVLPYPRRWNTGDKAHLRNTYRFAFSPYEKGNTAPEAVIAPIG